VLQLKLGEEHKEHEEHEEHEEQGGTQCRERI
jgi:hypothetical protein